MKTNFFVRTIFILLLASVSAYAENKPTGKDLYEAAIFQDIPKMERLIAAGADVNYMENGRPILGWTSQGGNVRVVEKLLASGANPNVADIGVGHTPLMRAIETQFVDIVEALLKAKADPNAKNPDDESCLMMAVETRKPKIVSALIAAGADVRFVNAEGNSPALYTAQDASPESLEILKMLGEAKANMNASNAAYTPLVYAVEQGNKDLVQILLNAGADPNAKTSRDTYPIIRALDNQAVLELLLKNKADPNIISGYGDTPLTYAIRGDYLEAVKTLLTYGADPQKPDSTGNTPLQIAQQNYKKDMEALLQLK